MRIFIAVLFLALPLFAQDPEKKEPPALVKARADYQTEVARVLTPVTKTYLDKLEALKKDLGAKGKIEEAMAVQQEIEAVTPKTVSKDPSIVGTWLFSYPGGDSRVVVLARDGKATVSDGSGRRQIDTGTWSRIGKKWRIQWSHGADILTPTDNPNKLSMADEGGGASATCTRK